MNPEIDKFLNSLGVPITDRPVIGQVEWKSNDIFNLNRCVQISWDQSVIKSNYINGDESEQTVITYSEPGSLDNKKNIEELKKIRGFILNCNSVPHPSWIIQKKANNRIKIKMGR